MSKKNIDPDFQMGELIPPINTVCSFCGKKECECRFLICPFHGKVNAKDDGKNFRCPIDECEITRSEKELES